MLKTALDTIGTNGPATLVLAAIVGAAIFVVVTGWRRGERQVQSVEGDSAPATIKAAIERQTEELRQNTQAKREEKAAIDKMTSHVGVLVETIAASNRLHAEVLKSNEAQNTYFADNNRMMTSLGSAVGRMEDHMATIREFAARLDARQR